MEASNWNLYESIEDLKLKLHYTMLEMKTMKLAAIEERKQNEMIINQLVDGIKKAYGEIDELKELRRLLSHCIQPQVLLETTMEKSSITESNSFSEPFFDTLSSPESPVMQYQLPLNLQTHQPILQNQSSNVKYDYGSELIDRIGTRKLPEKGKLLQAVMDAGPLLQTMLVAGPLPQWRNEPPSQAFQIPLVPIRGNGFLPISQDQLMPANALEIVVSGKDEKCLSLPSMVASEAANHWIRMVN